MPGPVGMDPPIAPVSVRCLLLWAVGGGPDPVSQRSKSPSGRTPQRSRGRRIGHDCQMEFGGRWRIRGHQASEVHRRCTGRRGDTGPEWRQVRDGLGAAGVTTHSFRKSLATLIDDEGLSARIGADQLGHTNVSTPRSPARLLVHTVGSPSTNVERRGEHSTGHPSSADGLSVRIQLLSSRDRVVWPSERRVLVQRYTDAPTAELLVPTLPAFAASKTSTWADRHSARDLWDLWALNEVGSIDQQAADLYRRHGPTNRSPSARLFTKAPTDAEWRRGARTHDQRISDPRFLEGPTNTR
jgi:hypothetical protein